MLKWKVDGLHKDIKITRTKIVIGKSGESLAEIIKDRGNTQYFIILPEDAVTHYPPSVYDSNRDYIAIYRSSLAIGDKSWEFDQFNHIEYYGWFKNRNMIRDRLYSPEQIEQLINLFILDKKLAAFK
jgi:hypothetical protein